MRQIRRRSPGRFPSRRPSGSRLRFLRICSIERADQSLLPCSSQPSPCEVFLMLRAVCLAMSVLVLPLELATAEAPPDAGANAALKYWQAFATLPRFTDNEQKNK